MGPKSSKPAGGSGTNGSLKDKKRGGSSSSGRQFEPNDILPNTGNNGFDISDLGKKQGPTTAPKSRNKYEDDPTRKPIPPKPNTGSDVSHHDIQKLIEQGRKVVRGLYDYVADVGQSNSDTKDLNFRVGDVMEILQEDGDWWLARNVNTRAEGYIPNTYVALVNSLQQFDWFHGKIGRKDAEKILLDSKNIFGTYLVRESESVAGAYSLSVLTKDTDGEKSIKHYRIRDMDNGGCYISAKSQCRSLEELVSHYSGQSDGLCSRLIKACPKMKPVMYDLSREARDKWEIDRKAVQMMGKLGSGNFGDVWEGVWNKTTPVAIKTLKPGTMEKDKFLEEAAIMKTLRHPKLIKLFAVCTRDEPILIITELMVNGCLLNYLRKDGGKTLKWNILVDIASQIAFGMMYIESQKHIHRDLAARNVLVGENNMIKIGDFGLARAIKKDDSGRGSDYGEEVYEAKQGAKFPIKWTAPEAINLGKFTIKSDVWAFGIVLIELVTHGATPYAGMSNPEVVSQLDRGYRHPQPKSCTDEMYAIMLECWHKNPDMRPTFESLFHTLDDFVVATQCAYVPQ